MAEFELSRCLTYLLMSIIEIVSQCKLLPFICYQEEIILLIMSALNRKRVRDYFDEESDEDNPNISSSNSEGIHKTNASHDNKQSSSHDDIDPLDAYMQDVEQVIQNSVPSEHLILFNALARALPVNICIICA